MTGGALRGATVLVLAAALWGCDKSEPCLGADGDADADGDGDLDGGGDGDAARECIIAEVECAPGEHPEYGVCVADSERISIPAGSFQMGAPSGEELPAHAVNVSAFVMDRTEVTNERFGACVAAGCCDAPTYDGSYSGRQPYFGGAEFGRYPVIHVTWEQARQYCEGQGGRLPTEAEWEYAARGTDGRMFPWGSDEPNGSRANYGRPGGSLDNGDTEEVGTHADGASPFGLQDMAGNVWEWVADWFSPTYYGESPADDPRGPDSGVTRVARGGSFGSASTELYSFYRTSFHPAESWSNVGFRCAR